MMLEEQTVTERHDYASMTLEELAASANENSQKVVEAESLAALILADGVRRAMDAGDALLAAKERVDEGGWVRWVNDNYHHSKFHASRYMRLAFYRDHVEDWISHGGDEGRYTLIGALIAIGDLPALPGGYGRHTDAMRSEVLRLHGDGIPRGEIVKLLNLPHITVRRWVDPKFAEVQRQRVRRSNRKATAARRALKEKEEREEKAKLAARPDDVGKAYSLVRQLTSALSQAQIAIESPEVRRHLREAEQLALKAEESIWRANQEMQADE